MLARGSSFMSESEPFLLLTVHPMDLLEHLVSLRGLFPPILCQESVSPSLPGPFSPFSGPEALFFHLPGPILPFSGPVGDGLVVEVRWSTVFGEGNGKYLARIR